MSKEQIRLDRDRPHATVYGPAPYRHEQDGMFFAGDGRRVNADGSDYKPGKSADEAAPQPEGDAAPPKEKKPREKRIKPDPTTPYEDDPEATLAQLRARYKLLSRGKTLAVGSDEDAYRNAINTIKAEALS